MPRIEAPTVAEHHARQRRALLDAARALLAETGEAPSMAATGRRAGLARSSVYQYFASSEELLQAVVADVFPAWAEDVRRRVEAAPTPGEQVWAYVVANVDLFASSEQAVAQALSRVVDPQLLHGPMRTFHHQLQVPLRQALTRLGEPDVAEVAATIDAMIVSAARPGEADCRSEVASRDAALSRLRRLLGGYLGLPADGP
ncbi:MAG: TetR/AcrR family transcriptional regulator [Nocardioides sp.]|nr:TetR/AcrR family transcriptional regulator [Nocardioides sp.]